MTIKFRAWDKKLKQMLRPSDVIVQGDGKTSTPDILLLQYTGLKDKNGVEIYSGDVVRVRYLSCDYQSHEYGHQECIDHIRNEYQFVATLDIDYDNGLFHLPEEPNDCIKTGLKEFEDEKSWVGVEVIGNIYQNPELLEENDN